MMVFGLSYAVEEVVGFGDVFGLFVELVKDGVGNPCQ